ncbi:PREDICTED: F-box protein At5g03970-like [Nicotiana attenuata]|nr:PREDICTED: F-box protein At5g03970-like [Nicotiana attenuata]
MKRLCKSPDKGAGALPEEIIFDILHGLPSKSLARFKCVSKCWRKYIPQPNLIGFFYQARDTRLRSQIRFFSSSLDESPSSRLVNNITSLEESVKFLGKKKREYIVASSNGFLLFVNNPRVYYVYNPVTRQRLALPKTKIRMKDPAVGFFCKVDDPGKDVASFTIVRYALPSVWGINFTSITIESFSSETNIWTANNINLDVPLTFCPSWDIKTSSAGVIDGVFCWFDQRPQITVYDSVHKCLWALALPESEEIVAGRDSSCFLGISGGALYLVLNDRFGSPITVWYLESNIRSRDAVWVRKYVANTVVKCPQAFGLASLHVIEKRNMVIHPTVPHIFYFVVRGKVISYDLETNIAELVYDFGEPCWKTRCYTLFSYEWHHTTGK